MSVLRVLLAALVVAAAPSLACTAPGEAPEETVGVEELDLRSDEESFAAYDATDEESVSPDPLAAHSAARAF